MIIFVVFLNCRLSPASKMKDLLLCFKQAERIEWMLDGAIIEMDQANLTFSTSSHEAIHRQRCKILAHFQLIIKKWLLIFIFLYWALLDEFEIGFTIFGNDISTWGNSLYDHLLLFHLIFLFVCGYAYHFLGGFDFFCLFGHVGLSSVVFLTQIDL